MWWNKIPVALCCAAVLGATGCIYPAERGRALEAKVQRLDDKNAQLASELEKTRAELSATAPVIDAKIREVTAALESLDQASRRTGADTAVQLQKTIEDVASLRGQLELQLHQLGELRAALERAEAVAEQKMLAMLGPEAVKQWEARKKLQDLERPTEPKAFIALAHQRAKDGDAPVARRLYDEFLRKWPKDPQAGEAHFGQAELLVREDRCRDALFHLGRVIQEHSKSTSAPQAYLRASECFGKLKMSDESRLALEDLVKAHPNTDAGKIGKARLVELDKSRAPPRKGGR